MKMKRISEGRALEYTFTVKEWDGNEPDDDTYLETFAVEVTYEVEDLTTAHPYGEDSAVESIYDLGLVSMETVDPVNLIDADTEEVIEVFPAGTDVRKIPGWTDENEEWFYDAAVEHYEKYGR